MTQYVVFCHTQNIPTFSKSVHFVSTYSFDWAVFFFLRDETSCDRDVCFRSCLVACKCASFSRDVLFFSARLTLGVGV